jgi:hypothetical protein
MLIFSSLVDSQEKQSLKIKFVSEEKSLGNLDRGWKKRTVFILFLLKTISTEIIDKLNFSIVYKNNKKV